MHIKQSRHSPVKKLDTLDFVCYNGRATATAFAHWDPEMNTKLFPTSTLVPGSQSGDTIQILNSLQGYDYYIVKTLAGSIALFPSLTGPDDVGGANYNNPQLVLSQEPAVAANVVTETEGTFAAVSSTTKLAYFFGDFRSVKAVQVGATPAQIQVLGVAK